MSIVRHTLLVTLLLLLAGCGFQLRGTASALPEVMQATLIQPASNTAFYYEVQNTIRAAGGTVATDAETASAILTIHTQRFSRRSLGVDHRGRTNAYEHQLQLVFSLRDREGREIAKQESIQLYREQRFNPDQVLSLADEQEMLYGDMRRQAISQMMHRLQALSQQYQQGSE